MEAGVPFDIVPYGTEALGVMRIEKGHAAGNELNGTTTALNLGLGRMVSSTKDSIGSILSRREGLTQPDAVIQVGFKPINHADTLDAGAHLMRVDDPINAAHDQGYITSVCYSPSLGHSIGLGFLSNGSNRIGEIIRAVNPLQGRETLIEVVSPHFIDPEGERLHA
jgi:sarcosine oxidase subunit alpha